MQARAIFTLVIMLWWVRGAGAFEIEQWRGNASLSHRHFALLFIHDLGGDPSTTFGEWLRVIEKDNNPLINEEYGTNKSTVTFADFDIFLANYDTNTTNLSLVDIGNKFANQIEETNSIFRRYDMVFVVTHSLGGLVLHQAFNVLVARDHFAWFRFMPAVLELGVPVNGSLFADVANSFPDGVVAYLGYNPALVTELHTGPDFLSALNKNWADIISARSSEGWPLVYCGYEVKSQLSPRELAVARQFGTTDGIVVSNLYASNACNTGAPEAIDASHIDLTKVDAVSHGSHQLLRKMVEDTLRKLQDKRYVMKDKSDDLYGTLSRIASASTSKSAEDRETHVRLYKERIKFVDPQGITRSVPVEDQVTGWSIDDAARRLAGLYSCLKMMDDTDELTISVTAGVPCAR